MPLDQAVLDWEVDRPHRRRERRAPGRGRRRRGPPRHGHAAARGASTRPACAPVGIDLSAFGMIRALQRRSQPGVGAADFVAAPAPPTRTASRASRAPTQPVPRRRDAADGAALLQPRRRRQPRGRPGLQLPLHPDLAVRDRGHRPEARRASRADPRARAPVARSTSASPGPGRGDRGRPRDRRAPPARSLDEGAGKLADELRLSLEYYGAQEARRRGRGDRRLRPGDDDPGPRRAPAARPRPPVRGRPPGGARAARRRHGGPPDPLLRPGAGGLAMRPVNLIPPEERRGDRAAAAHRRAPLRDPRRARRSPLAMVTVLTLTGNGINEREAEVAALEAQEAEADRPRRGARALRRVRRRSRRRATRPSPASPRAASTGSGCCASSRW